MTSKSVTNVYTPETDPQAALHWAACARNLADRKESLTHAEQATYDRYQTAAYHHGITDDQIREYADGLLRDLN